MARPRSFDEDRVVERAVDLFWLNGYSDTSTRDLSRELGLNPSSLYRAFGDKQGLYLRALDRYAEREGGALAGTLGGDGSVMERLARWLGAIVDDLCDDPDGRGCLMVNAVLADGEAGPAGRERAGAAFDAVRDALVATLREGRETGELAADLDVEAAAELLLSTLLGLKIQGRAGADRDRLRRGADMALRALR